MYFSSVPVFIHQLMAKIPYNDGIQKGGYYGKYKDHTMVLPFYPPAGASRGSVYRRH